MGVNGNKPERRPFQGVPTPKAARFRLSRINFNEGLFIADNGQAALAPSGFGT